MTTPNYSWPDETIPQPHLDGRKLNCGMGKGLGGSTAVNFCAFTRGASGDYDYWATLVDDATWNWKNVQTRFQKVRREFLQTGVGLVMVLVGNVSSSTSRI